MKFMLGVLSGTAPQEVALCSNPEVPMLAVGWGFHEPEPALFYQTDDGSNPPTFVSGFSDLNVNVVTTGFAREVDGIVGNGCRMIVSHRAFGSDKKPLQLYDTGEGRPYTLLAENFGSIGVDARVGHIELSPDGDTAYISQFDTTNTSNTVVDRINMSDGSLVDTVGVDRESLKDGLKVSPDGTMMAHLSGNAVLEAFDLTQSPPTPIPVPDQSPLGGAVWEMTFHPNLPLLVLFNRSPSGYIVYDISGSSWVPTPNQPPSVNKMFGSGLGQGVTINHIDNVMITAYSNSFLSDGILYGYDASDPDPGNWYQINVQDNGNSSNWSQINNAIVDSDPTDSGSDNAKVKFSPDGSKLGSFTGDVWDCTGGLPYVKTAEVTFDSNRDWDQNTPITFINYPSN